VSRAPHLVRIVCLSEQFSLARGEVLAKGIEVEVAIANLREHLAFLFLHVVVDVFAQDLDLGVIQRVLR